MLNNYFRAALADLRRSPAQSLIGIGGLAIGLSVVLLASVIAIAAFSRDHFVPGYDRLYLTIFELHSPQGDQYLQLAPNTLAGYLKNYPEVDRVVRVSGGPVVIQRDSVLVRESADWADPDFFRVYRMPALFGNLDTALDQPDGAVVNLSTARKLFGEDDVVRRTLEINHAHRVTIKAVIADQPLNAAYFNVGLFLSGRSSFSLQSQTANLPGMSKGSFRTDMYTLVRVKPGASVEALNKRATALLAGFVPKNSSLTPAVHFERIDRVHTSPTVSPSTRPRLFVMAAIATVILLLSCVNFINLSIARSARRGVEVAIRKATGAARTALVAQFLGEAVLQVLLALVVAAGFVEWSLPPVNAFLQTGAVFDYWRNPLLLAGMIIGAIVIGILAGIYPGLVLSRFRPIAVLKGIGSGSIGGVRLRQWLVGFQFAAMMVLLIAAGVVFQQNEFTTTEARRVPTDQTVMIQMPQCSETLQNGIAALPNVRGVACSSVAVLPVWDSDAGVRPQRGGQNIILKMKKVGFGFLELYGLDPVAGRFFARGRGDEVGQATPDRNVHYVVDETAVRQMGFADSRDAIGKPINFSSGDMHGTIIGVVKNFSLVPPHDPDLKGAALAVGNTNDNPAPPELLHVKLRGQHIPETLAAIDAEWKKSGQTDPIQRQFLDEYIQEQDINTLRTGQAFAVFAAIAMLLACLGLFGISLYTAARRTKEIGVRKAMGATSPHIARLLLWQFAKPILWANLASWPIAWYAMDHWLNGFAYHVALDWRIFACATLATLLVAIATVAMHSIATARALPVTALKYE